MDAVRAVVTAVRDGLADLLGDLLGDEEPGQLVLVACSGGPDSLALAAATARVAVRHRLRAGAVLVDHGWTLAATRALARTAVVLKERGLDPVEVVAVRPGRHGGPEAAAREARYAALQEAAYRLGAAAVLLGHTLDDQAETVLLGLGRGSGARSLAGMASRRGVFRRPFLGLRRAVPAAACAALGLRPWSDPANADPRYTRVRVRALAGSLDAALGAGAVEALARTGDLLREDADTLDALASALLAAATIPSPIKESLTALAVAPLREAPVAVRRRALLAAARDAGCPPGALSRAHAASLDALLGAEPGGQAHLPGGVRAVRDAGSLTFRCRAGTGQSPPGHVEQER